MEDLNEDQIGALRKAFDSFDTDKSGAIIVETVQTILRMMGLKVSELDNRLTEEDIEGIVDEVDEDGSGTLDFDEFQQMMTG